MRKLFLVLAVMAALVTGAQAQWTTVNATVLNSSKGFIANAKVTFPSGQIGTTNGSGFLSIKLPAPLKPDAEIVVTTSEGTVVLVSYFEPANAGVQNIELDTSLK